MSLKPLRVALLHYDNPRQFDRAVGIWSYDVPEFEVTHYGMQPFFRIRRSDFAGKHDIIIREDHRCYGILAHDSKIPLCYYVVDSPASDDHYQKRRQVAALGHDLILVEQDRLERFEKLKAKVYRCGYCVNDRFYRDYGLEKTVDVSMFYRPISPERGKLDRWLKEFCTKRNYVYERGKRMGESYPKGFNRSKISINLGYNPNCRPHRVFDVMACRGCLVTNPLPDVSGEIREAGTHYLEFENYDHLGQIIDDLLASGRWREISDAAYKLVQERHTWRVRAGELRQILSEALGV
jgi:hypothetical protein